MGCDIHCHAEQRDGNRWTRLRIPEPFDWRSYGLFGFLAGVRNYSEVPVLRLARGFPKDASGPVYDDYTEWAGDAHTPSWLTLKELSDFDYDATFEDRRVTRQVAANAWDGGCTAEPGGGEQTTYRKFLGPKFFTELERLKEAGADRIVFWFDN